MVWGGGELCVISVGIRGSRIRPPLVEAARIRAKSMVFENFGDKHNSKITLKRESGSTLHVTRDAARRGACAAARD